MKRLIFFIFALSLSSSLLGQYDPEFPFVKFVDYQSENRQWFVKYAQCQLFIEYKEDEATGLVNVLNPENHYNKIIECLEKARQEKVKVLVFPEISLALPTDIREKLISQLETFARDNDAIIIAGTYYNEKREGVNIIVLPTKTVSSYKIRPSIYEASPLADYGMKGGDTLCVFRTKYGNILPIVCVDLISDDINYMARSLSNRGLVDVIHIVEYNPKSQEFMREASSLSHRHPVFVALTNATLHQKGDTYDTDEYGNTSIFGSINDRRQQKQLLKKISDFYKTSDLSTLQPAYASLLGIIPPEKEGMLIYDLNLRVLRTPLTNNAPDQGYPTIKNLKVVDISK